jgi:hypothetical protein
MIRFQAIRSRSLLAVAAVMLVAGLTAPSTVTAQEASKTDLATFFPSHSIVYFDVSGLDTYRQKFNALPIWKDGSKIQGIFEAASKEIMANSPMPDLMFDPQEIEKHLYKAKRMAFALTDISQEVPVTMAGVAEFGSAADIASALTVIPGEWKETKAHDGVNVYELAAEELEGAPIGAFRATIGNFVVFGTDYRSVRDMINAANGRGDENLANETRFKEARARKQANAYAFGYLNFDQLFNAIERLLERRDRKEYDAVDTIIDFRSFKYLSASYSVDAKAPYTEVVMSIDKFSQPLRCGQLGWSGVGYLVG